jgi:hypothetical protein
MSLSGWSRLDFKRIKVSEMSEKEYLYDHLRLSEAVTGGILAHDARETAASNHEVLLAERLAEASKTMVDNTRHADEQLGIIKEMVAKGRERAGKDIDPHHRTSPPVETSLISDNRLGLLQARQATQDALYGVQDGARALLLWRARRASIMSGAGITALALLVLTVLFIIGRFVRDEIV